MATATEYQPFPNDEGRNTRQSQLEIPAMVRALGIPSDTRILEVGLGGGSRCLSSTGLQSPAAGGSRHRPGAAGRGGGEPPRAWDVGELLHRRRPPDAFRRRSLRRDHRLRHALPHLQTGGCIGRDSSGPRSGRDVRPRDEGLAVALASGPFAGPASAAVGARRPAASALGDALGLSHQGVLAGGGKTEDLLRVTNGARDLAMPPRLDLSLTLGPTRQLHGSRKYVLAQQLSMELGGFEPPTSWVRSRRSAS